MTDSIAEKAEKSRKLFLSPYKEGELYKTKAGYDFHENHIYTEEDIKDVIKWCQARKASDIFIAGDDMIRASFSGKKRAITKYPVSKSSMKDLVNQMTKSSGLNALQSGHDVDMKYPFSSDIELEDGSIIHVSDEFRLNATAIIDKNGEEKTFEISLRTFAKEPPSALRDLGIEREIFDNFYIKNGLNLITGATGNGKTTTLYGIYRDMGENPECDLRVLDYAKPIEYRLPGPLEFKNMIFRQTEVGEMLRPSDSEQENEDRQWRRAGENSLRRAANIINIAEARDTSAFRQIMECATTGHLAVTTLHTNSVASTFQRAIDFFPYDERQYRGFDLVNILNLVVCQRLLPLREGQGVIALREYMVFSEAVRHTLVSSGDHPSEWSKTIKTLMKKYSNKGHPDCLCRSMKDHLMSFPAGTFRDQDIKDISSESEPTLLI